MRKIYLILCTFLTCISLIAQNANVSYEVRRNSIYSSEGSSFSGSSCQEGGQEEYSANVRIDNPTTGTNYCSTCNTNGNCTYGNDNFVLQASNNVATTSFQVAYDIFEDDGGDRCTYNSGDDCRAVGSYNIPFVTNYFPSAANYVNTTDNQVYNAGSSEHRIRIGHSWRYAGTASLLTPNNTCQSASVASGAIRSWSVNMTAGVRYAFSNYASGADTYLRIYGSDGYTIVATGDDNGPHVAGAAASVEYTAASTGTYYVELSNWSRANLSTNSTLYYWIVPASVAGFGANTWNILGYNKNNIDLSGVTYVGYYNLNAVSYNTGSQWTNSPSDASGWAGGCVHPDYHTVVAKRQGFPTGYYTLSIPTHDDDIRVYINGVNVFEHIGGCCDAHNCVWAGTLDASSTMEVRHIDGTGGSQQAITLTPTINPATYGTNQWNVYAYNGSNFNNYVGYYTTNRTNEFNIGADGMGALSNPSAITGGTVNGASVSAFAGCGLGNDTWSISAKRQGFPCAVYNINLVGHDDDYVLNIDYDGNGTVDFNSSAGCCNIGLGTKWTGVLNSSSRIEIQLKEGGGDAYIDIDFVTITPAIGGGTISGITNGINICNNTDPGSFSTSGAASGGTVGYTNGGTYTYQWESSTTSSSTGFSNISSATGQTYNPANLTATTWFRRKVTDMCGNTTYSNVIQVVVRPTPTATISGATTVCQNATTPNITFTNPQSLPVTITYNINGGANTTINVGANTTATVAAPTGTAGTFTYNLVNVFYQTAPNCTNTISGSAAITVRPTPTASISGTTTICQNAASPNITFTNPQSLPVTITYNINGGANTSVNVAANSTTNISVLTGTAGAFAYNLVNVFYQTTPNCTNNITGTATVNILANPTGGSIAAVNICSGAVAAVSITGASNATQYSWVLPAGFLGSSATSSINVTAPSVASTTNYTITAYPQNVSGGTTCTGAAVTGTISVFGTTISVAAPSGTSPLTQCDGGNPLSFSVAPPTGGNGSYSYQWQQSAGCTGTWVNAVDESGGSTGLSFNPPALSLPTTSICYRLRVTDGCGNIGFSALKTYNIVADPTAPSATKSPNVAIACAGQSLTLTGAAQGSGGTGTCNIEYATSTNGGVSYSAWSTTLPTITATGTDNRIKIRTNCTGTGCNVSPEVTYTWSVVPVLSLTPSGTNVSCFGGSNGTASVSATGGTGTYTYSWYSGGSGNSISGLPIGTYTVLVTSATCTATTAYTVTQPTALSASLSNVVNDLCQLGLGAVQITATGGTAPYTISKSPINTGTFSPLNTIATSGGQTQIINIPGGTTLNITVTDAKGCVFP